MDDEIIIEDRSCFCGCNEFYRTTFCDGKIVLTCKQCHMSYFVKKIMYQDPILNISSIERYELEKM